MSKALDALDDMKYKILLWLGLCAIACLIVAIMFLTYPQVMTQGFPENSNALLINLSLISLMFLFTLGPLGIVYLIIDFIGKSGRNVRVENAMKKHDIDALVKLLRDPDDSVRSDAAKALGVLKDPKAIDPLIEALGHEQTVWASVAGAVQSYGVAIAMPLITQLAAKPNIAFGASAYSTAPVNVDRSGNLITAEGWPMAITYGPQAISLLINQLGSPDKAIQMKAYKVLDSFGTAAEEPLTEAVGHQNPAIRAKAVELLSKSGSMEGLESFIRAAKDPDLEVRLAAVRALGMSGDQKAAPVLKEALNDEGHEVRETAAFALEKIRAQAAHPSDPQANANKEVVTREIVKVPCSYCGTQVDVTSPKCPGCGAPLYS